ncbi:hypothetical protein B0T14DRAFT_97449 [Immersiella caudata]|uniref:Uncharacterized protein n=1 Tax=Immersiella caudata TaxID=314043 RepID=A0AA39X2S3_9PEZI|nr:hypothetical protein B0T14DRAFT_97449 [Immersiella caudata]
MSPGSPIDEPMSRTPSIPATALEDEKDEIVVGTNANKHLLSKGSPLQAPSEPADVDMDDAETASVTSQKRKRVSTYGTLGSEDTSSPAPRQELPGSRPPRFNRPAKTHGVNGVKGTLLGYWRDSTPKDPKDKHGVIGFIDVRDRLRTRIQPTTRDGRNIVHEFPLPPGPGGSWVTFQQVAFDPHLVNLNQHQVKEYVKIRVEDEKHRRGEETADEREVNEKAAVQEALRRLQENPPAPGATEPLVAYGTDIPEHALPQNRPEAKKRKLNPAAQPNWSVPGVQPVVQLPSQLDVLPGSRPTRILLGYWKNSDQVDERDRHAVYGILGSNDMFRIKLVRETRDGRPCNGNFPQGAGALWIHWDECVFEPHLRDLTRPEVKEYVRVRQAQLDRGEKPDERVANETKAVYEAQQRVAQAVAMGIPTKFNEHTRRDEYMNLPIAIKAPPATNGNGYEDGHSEVSLPVQASEYPPLEPRPRRADTGPRGRHSLPDVELRAANRPPPSSALQRTNDLARRQVDRLETATMRQEQRAMDRQQGGSMPPFLQENHNKMQFDDNVSRLNKVWAQQEANRLKAGAEDAKIFMGIKYERKQNGPFEGKLVSQGTIISIDGEDYVEYRVLTKPSFF